MIQVLLKMAQGRGGGISCTQQITNGVRNMPSMNLHVNDAICMRMMRCLFCRTASVAEMMECLLSLFLCEIKTTADMSELIN